ncbi:MAG: M20/M25/M40 family metallo-hydrolase [Alphaproteobacteria bacterium]|nr:M20/M25/M40 family metallo-hydrolase [Alphaproteobacteria bacterium]
MKKAALAFVSVLLLSAAAPDQPSYSDLPMGKLRPDQVAFRALYQELVETNTTLSSGSCTDAAQKLAAHLKNAGFPAGDVTVFTAPGHPKEGGLVAFLPGAVPALKPILLLAHLDVVEAKRSDWVRDPFKLVEENNYFYARGASDDKAMAAVWVDALMRFRRENYRPRRGIRMALTCGEESIGAFNGAQWLAANHPDWLAAEFALNEAGGGRTDSHGKLLVQTMQVGEKTAQDFRIETFNAGGHSSIPIRDNAIYELSAALLKIQNYEFPLQLNDTTRAYFALSGAAQGGAMGKAMVALSRNPNDKAAEAVVSADRSYHAMLRTTCVATLLTGGHADNALPQHAEATVNCRIFPGETIEVTAAALARAIGDPKVKVTADKPRGPLARPVALDPKVMEPARALVAKYFPGVPLIPAMSAGATDGIFLEAMGVPTYGVPGSWSDPDQNGIHGLNERKSTRALFVGRDFLTDLVKAYAEAG